MCVGRLEEVKNFHHVIGIMRDLIDDNPGLRLKIVGDGSCRAEWQRFAAIMGLKDDVIFEGMQSDLVDYYARAKATILTSTYEGFPNVLVESLACGTPVVAYNCPSGPREIIDNDVNGYLVNYMDRKDLKLKIQCALNKEWDIAAIQKSANRYHPDIIMDVYKNYLEDQIA